MTRRKVISFDGDDTLWDFSASQSAGLALVLNTMVSLGMDPNAIDVPRMIEIRTQAGEDLGEDQTPLLTLRREGFRRVAVEAGIDPTGALLERLMDEYLAERDRSCSAFEDVEPALDELVRDGWTVTLLSNGNTALGSVGLERYFHAALYAEDIGVGKPNPAAFAAVARAADCEVNELVHVGDSLQNDVLGARKSGATAIWLNRGGVVRSTEVTPHHEISSLAALPAILSALSR